MIDQGMPNREKILFQKLDNNFIFIRFSGNCLNPFGNVIHNDQYILFPNELGNGTIKSIPHTSNISISMIGCGGITLHRVTLPTYWHHVHVWQYFTASLKERANKSHYATTFWLFSRTKV